MFLTETQADYDVLVGALHRAGVGRFAFLQNDMDAIEPLVETDAYVVRQTDRVIYEIVRR